jgi:hypothetical protein
VVRERERESRGATVVGEERKEEWAGMERREKREVPEGRSDEVVGFHGFVQPHRRTD